MPHEQKQTFQNNCFHQGFLTWKQVMKKIKSQILSFWFMIVWYKVKIVCNFGQWSMMRINCAIKLLNSLLIHHNNFLCLVLKSNFTHEGKLHIKWYKISSDFGSSFDLCILCPIKNGKGDKSKNFKNSIWMNNEVLIYSEQKIF